jgi:phosphoenolpyruvate-protein phosphotransferase (PTS system enzyme I)
MKTRRFSSSATSPGIAIGLVHRLDHHGLSFIHTWIKDADVEDEVLRFRTAVQRSKDQLSHIQAKMCRYQGHDQIKIIESYRMFLQDEMLVATTIKHIKQFKINAEWALDKTLAHLKLSFLNVNEEYFRERQQDIDYVGRRLMDNLIGAPDFSFSEIPEGEHILVVRDFSPAEVASLPRDRVRGFVMEAGGETSHTAIIARALEIPALFGLNEIYDSVADGEQFILDGIKGLAVASPPRRELAQYRLIQQKYHALEQILLEEIHLPAETKDGFRIKIEANMELVEEIPTLLQHGAEGIGLYRTEYLFLDRLDEPSEEEQYENYVSVLTQLAPQPVTIRTIDLGADKLPLSQPQDLQANPALGLRAIRLCLRELPMFKTQLRALLRASVQGNLRILVPMISNLEEVRQVQKILRDVRRDLAAHNIPVADEVPLGIMIEVPSAVFMAPELAREVDFFSIGTNDLIQYGLAIDRVNEQVADLYNPFHPAVLRMIAQAVEAAKKADIDVAICGELAGDPLAIALMVGLELDALSMNPISIPRVKKILRSITKGQAAEILREALTLTTADDVERLLKKRTSHLLPVDIRRLHLIDGQPMPG